MPRSSGTTVQVGEDPVGGLVPIQADALPPHRGGSATVDEVEDRLALVPWLGGKVPAPVIGVPAGGRVAVLQDSQGAVRSEIGCTMPSGGCSLDGVLACAARRGGWPKWIVR